MLIISCDYVKHTTTVMSISATITRHLHLTKYEENHKFHSDFSPGAIVTLKFDLCNRFFF